MPILNSNKKIYDHFKFLIDEDQECFYLIGLDNKGELKHEVMVSKGPKDAVNICPTALAKEILASQCENIMILHNHPNAEADPSEADDETTQSVMEICKLLGCRLINHYIIADKQLYSSIRGVKTVWK